MGIPGTRVYGVPGTKGREMRKSPSMKVKEGQEHDKWIRSTDKRSQGGFPVNVDRQGNFMLRCCFVLCCNFLSVISRPLGGILNPTTFC